MALDARNESHLDVMMMPLVHRVATVAPFELDAVAYDAVNRADLDAIGPDDLHILFDLVLRYDFLLRSISYTEIASAKRLSGQKAWLGHLLRTTASSTVSNPSTSALSGFLPLKVMAPLPAQASAG